MNEMLIRNSHCNNAFNVFLYIIRIYFRQKINEIRDWQVSLCDNILSNLPIYVFVLFFINLLRASNESIKYTSSTPRRTGNGKPDCINVTYTCICACVLNTI